MKFGVTSRKEMELRARMQACELREEDLEERFIRSSGPGGQHVNRSATGVYLKHVPTGLEVKMQRARSQGLNRFYARRRMCELIENRTLGAGSPTPNVAPSSANRRIAADAGLPGPSRRHAVKKSLETAQPRPEDRASSAVSWLRPRDFHRSDFFVCNPAHRLARNRLIGPSRCL